MNNEKNYRAYDVVTEWSGPPRATTEEAQTDVYNHNVGCAQQGGYGRAMVCMRDPDCFGRLVDLDGIPVWPPHGRSCGSARWEE